MKPTKNSTRFGSAYIRARVLVFGSTGFVGRWVSRRLTAMGADLFLPVRNRKRAEKVFAEYSVTGQLLRFDCEDQSVSEIVARVNPDIAFNLVGYGINPDEQDENLAYKLNAEFVSELCDAVFEKRRREWKGQHLVHAGTAMEYGAAKGDLNENTEPIPTTVYGKSKLAGTKSMTAFADRTGLKGVTCRLFALYGPGEHANRLVPLLFRSCRTQGRLEFTAGEHKRDFGYVAEIADGLLRIGAARNLSGSVLNLATGKLTKIRSFVEIVARELDIESSRLAFGVLPTRKEEMDHAPVSIEKMKRSIHWSPQVGISEGIKRAMSFLECTGT